MISAYAHLFHGDGRRSENPSNFLQSLEDSSANIPGISDSDKCQRFYLKCKADFDAEHWYEELKSNSPMVLTSWPTFVNHFRVRWLGAPLSLLLEPEPVISKKPDTATPIVRETTTLTHANTATTTTTTIPAPANTAALAVYKTTTTPVRLDRVADAHHVIAPPMLIPAQLEAKTTDASTNPSPPDIRATFTAVRQHSRAKEEPEVERVEKLEAEAPGTGRERMEASALDIEEQETIEGTQNEVRDPAPSPTHHTVFNAMLHEPTWFDWAAEVDEACGLSPVVRNTMQPASVNAAPTPPGNLIPDDVIVDPVRTTLNHSAHASPHPALMLPKPEPIPAALTDPNLNAPVEFPSVITVITAPANPNCTPPMPSQLVCVLPKPTVTQLNGDVAPHARTPAMNVPSDSTSAASVPIDTIPVDPDPSDVGTNPAGVALANTVPTDHTPVDHSPAVPTPTNPNPGDAAANTTGPVFAFASATPGPINPVYIVSANLIPADPNAIVCVDPIYITPAEPVHVDPVSNTHINFPIYWALTAMATTHARSLNKFCKSLDTCFVNSHFYFYFISRVRGSQGESFRSRTRTFACLGGALVTVSLGSLHHELCSIRGPGSVSESFRVL